MSRVSNGRYNKLVDNNMNRVSNGRYNKLVDNNMNRASKISRSRSGGSTSAVLFLVITVWSSTMSNTLIAADPIDYNKILQNSIWTNNPLSQTSGSGAESNTAAKDSYVSSRSLDPSAANDVQKLLVEQYKMNLGAASDIRGVFISKNGPPITTVEVKNLINTLIKVAESKPDATAPKSQAELIREKSMAASPPVTDEIKKYPADGQDNALNLTTEGGSSSSSGSSSSAAGASSDTSGSQTPNSLTNNPVIQQIQQQQQQLQQQSGTTKTESEKQTDTAPKFNLGY